MKFSLTILFNLSLIGFFTLTSFHAGENQRLLSHSKFQLKDTCVIQNLVFEIEQSTSPNPLKADIKNGRLRIFDLSGTAKNCRVIRYVFSDRSDERISSIRAYGDLISYPILLILKDAKPDEHFYFEEIIIVDQNKEIRNNAVRPMIIKRISN